MPALLDALAGVSWAGARQGAGGLAGVHRSRLRGLTAEFTEYRPYRQGEDPRRLDWKLLARTDRPFLRITDDHATRVTRLVLDASGSMAFPADSRQKWIQAALLTLGLAAVARSDGDPVGLWIPRQPEALVVPPHNRQGVLTEMIAALDGVEPGGRVSLLRALDQLRPGERVALLTDFLDQDAELLARARGLVLHGVELIALHVVDPAEIDPGPASFLATDPEDPSVRRALHEESRLGYVDQFRRWRESLAGEWLRAGVAYHVVLSDQDPARVIRRLVLGQAGIGAA